MENLRPLPKNSSMALAETLITVNGLMLKSVDVPKQKNNTFVVDLDELQDLATITESTFDNTYLFHAINELEKIEKNVRTLLVDNIQQIIKDAKNRICEDCGGSGMVEPSNPNSKDCPNCKGGGLS